MSETCKSCRWWKGRRNVPPEQEVFVRTGACRRRAPYGMSNASMMSEPYALWPRTQPEETCGDYKLACCEGGHEWVNDGRAFYGHCKFCDARYEPACDR